VCPDVYVKPLIKFRRLLGLPDYSRKRIWKSGFLPVEIRSALLDAIMLANYEKDFVTAITQPLEQIDPRTGKKILRKGVSIGENMAAYMYHYQITPEQFNEFTMPQINAINDYSLAYSRDNKPRGGDI
jgi:hypothetical protein